MDGGRETVHATAIAIGRRAALIRGPSGAGKSDLALRCLAAPKSQLFAAEPVHLVADDQVILSRHGGPILVSAPHNLQGKLEVRGVGILTVPSVITAELVLVADLVAAGAYERLPDPERRVRLLGLDLPLIEIVAFETSAALKVLLVLQRIARS